MCVCDYYYCKSDIIFAMILLLLLKRYKNSPYYQSTELGITQESVLFTLNDNNEYDEFYYFLVVDIYCYSIQ